MWGFTQSLSLSHSPLSLLCVQQALSVASAAPGSVGFWGYKDDCKRNKAILLGSHTGKLMKCTEEEASKPEKGAVEGTRRRCCLRCL